MTIQAEKPRGARHYKTRKNGLMKKEPKKKEKVNHILLCTADGDIIQKFPKLYLAVCAVHQGTKYGHIYYQLSNKGFYWTDEKKTEKLIHEFPVLKEEAL